MKLNYYIEGSDIREHFYKIEKNKLPQSRLF